MCCLSDEEDDLAKARARAKNSTHKGKKTDCSVPSDSKEPCSNFAPHDEDDLKDVCCNCHFYVAVHDRTSLTYKLFVTRKQIVDALKADGKISRDAINIEHEDAIGMIIALTVENENIHARLRLASFASEILSMSTDLECVDEDAVGDLSIGVEAVLDQHFNGGDSDPTEGMPS